MRTISIDRPAEWDVCEVHTFADLHLGDLLCDGKLLKERIKRAEETENCVCLLNGDLCNNAIPGGKSDTIAEQLSPMEQLKRVVELFGRLAEQDKIIALTDGNHERRTYRNTGVDLSEVIATQLGIHDRYSPGAVLVFLRFGSQGSNNHGKKVCYTIYANHGTGGGRMLGGKANRLVSMSDVTDCDVYVHSHTHEPLVAKRSFFRVNYGNQSVQRVDRLYINTAAYNNGYGGYAEQAEYSPQSTDTPVVYLDGTKRRLWATL